MGLVEVLRDRAPAAVLDIGAGDGAFLAELAAWLPSSLLVGADLATPGNRSDPVRFLQADAAQLPIGHRRVAAVTARAVLHHVDNPAETTAELARVVDDGGVLIVRDATAMPYAKAQELREYLISRGHPPEPHAGIDPDEVADAARDAGLTIEQLDRAAGTAVLAGPRFSTPAFQLVASRS